MFLVTHRIKNIDMFCKTIKYMCYMYNDFVLIKEKSELFCCSVNSCTIIGFYSGWKRMNVSLEYTVECSVFNLERIMLP